MTLIATIESQAFNKELNFKRRREEEKLKDNQARRGARKWFQACLLALLSFEILFIAYLILSQGIKALLFTNFSFSLTQLEFTPFINIALVQTCILIRPIAIDLFPGKKDYI